MSGFKLLPRKDIDDFAAIVPDKFPRLDLLVEKSKSFLPCTSKPRQDFKMSLLGMSPTDMGNFAVTQSVDAKALAILPNQHQTGVGGAVVGEFFYNKVGHVVLTFWANTILNPSHGFNIR